MPFKKFRDDYVWTPSQLTLRQRFAFWWPIRPPHNGEPRISFGVLLALTIIAFVLAVGGVGMSDYVVNVVVVALLGLVLGIEIGLIYLHTIALQTVRQLQRNHAFRFRPMQDPAPSFIVLDLYLHHRPPTLTSDQELAIEGWLTEMWQADNLALYGDSPWSTHVMRSSLTYDAVAEAVKTFWHLPLQLDGLEGFRTACDQLVDEYRRSFEYVLGREVDDRREQIETARHRLGDIERKLEVLRAMD